jgi:hypothetical protein
MTPLIDMQIGVARPILEPADISSLLSLVPGSVEIAEADVVSRDTCTPEGSQATRSKACRFVLLCV